MNKQIEINTLTFEDDIERLVSKTKMSYLDAIIHWTTSKGIELEYAATLIKKDNVMRAKLKAEAEDLNFIRRGPTLPF
jgi:hypothetical protein